MSLICDLQRSTTLVCADSPPDDLVFVDDRAPGIARRTSNDGNADCFTYRLPNGRALTDVQAIARIKTLGIPPAWKNVWICTDANGHLQATGIDDAGRKQYRYHPVWRAYRERTKFHSLLSFGAHLPQIRRKIRQVFRTHHKPDQTLVTTALIRLLDDAPLRIGSQKRSSDVVGASTLKRRNIAIDGDMIRFDYIAKGGKRVRRQIKDARLMKVFGRIDELPGRTLFQYVGEDGEVRPLRSEQVNQWLKETTGDDHITAKAFRTWAGSLAAFEQVVSAEAITIKAMSEAAAKVLRNSPAIARSSYIHPAIIDLNDAAFQQRRCLIDQIRESATDLTMTETAMLRFLADADTFVTDQIPCS